MKSRKITEKEIQRLKEVMLEYFNNSESMELIFEYDHGDYVAFSDADADADADTRYLIDIAKNKKPLFRYKRPILRVC